MLTKKQALLIVYLIILAWFIILIVYPFLHESGHLLSAIICGGKAHGMRLGFLQASVSFSGDFNNFQLAIVHISGAILPYVIWLVFIISIPKNVHFILEGFKILFSGIVIGSMLPWIIIPILFELNKAPAGDDVTKFMGSVNTNGFLISSIFLAVIAFSIILFIKKLGNIKDIFK